MVLVGEVNFHTTVSTLNTNQTFVFLVTMKIKSLFAVALVGLALASTSHAAITLFDTTTNPVTFNPGVSPEWR